VAVLAWAVLWLAAAARSPGTRQALAWDPQGIAAAFVHLVQVTLGLEWWRGAELRLLTTAMEARFARDTDRRQDICYADYNGNGSRVIVVPLITAPGSGRAFVTVMEFAAFFLRDVPRGGHDTLNAEFIHYIVPGWGTPGMGR